jgi:WD40 repeat protein/transcriptional regulator with XRE-family HTH domain
MQNPHARNNLRFEREQRGWLQEDIAAKIGCHPKTVSRWERGLCIPNMYYQQRLAKHFGKDVKDLGFLAELQQKGQDTLQHNGLRQQDWREVPPSGPFYGRKRDLAMLKQWIVDEHAGMVLISGGGGIGKTSLVWALAKKIYSSFSSTFWYSLQTAPPFREFVTEYMQFVSPQQHHILPEEWNNQVTYLLTWLQKQRSLLILDNFEAVLQSGDHLGKYREGYEAYGLLLERIAMGVHQSCLLLTSREKPREFSRLQGNSVSVRSLQLQGMTITEGRKILANQGLVGSGVIWTKLVQLYSGNPLALKLIIGHVREIFGGDTAAFLNAEKTVFGDIYDLLEQQFRRLSEQEQEIMYWLAIEYRPVRFQDLWGNIVYRVSKREVLETLASLRRRSFIEIGSDGQYSLQPVISEYVTEKLIQQIYRELGTQNLEFFRSIALTRAQAREDVRNIQARLILAPILALLTAQFGEQGSENELKHILALLRTTYARDHGYAAGNLLHLLINMRADLRGIDCSSLIIRQAYLRGVDLPEVNFSYAHFITSVFTDTFGSICCVAFSASGSLFAAGMSNGEIRLWRTVSLELLLTFRGHADGVRSVVFSPDSRLLASGSTDQTVCLWDVTTGRLRRSLYGHNGLIRCIAFHPNGQVIASGSEDRSIRIWEVSTGQCLKELHGHTNWIRTIAFSPDGTRLLSGGDDQSIRTWNIGSGDCLHVLQAHSPRVRSVAYSPNGCLFASVGDDQVIKVWDAHNGQLLHTLGGPIFCVRSLVFSPDGKQLAVGGDDHVIYRWETNTWSSLTTLHGHTNRIWSVAFHPEERILLSGSEDQTVRLWDIETGYCQHTLQGYRSLIWSIAFSPDNTLLSSGSDDGVCRIWKTTTERCLKTLRGHVNRVRCAAFSPDGTILASGSDDLTIRLWEVSTAQCIHILCGHRHLVRSLAFHPDGNILVSGSLDKSIRLWDVNTGSPLGTLQGCNSLVWGVAFSPDGNLIVSSNEDSNVRIWEIKTQTCLAVLQGHTHRVGSVAFSPDGQLIASGSDDQTIRIWRVSDGQCLACLKGHNYWVRSLAFSPDGKTIVSGSHDTTIRLWDVDTGRCYATFHGHRSSIWTVTFSPDGENVASGSDDGTIKLWERRTGKCLKTLISERPYEGMNITGVEGLNEAQKVTLKALGARIEQE